MMYLSGPKGRQVTIGGPGSQGGDISSHEGDSLIKRLGFGCQNRLQSQRRTAQARLISTRPIHTTRMAGKPAPAAAIAVSGTPIPIEPRIRPTYSPEILPWPDF